MNAPKSYAEAVAYHARESWEAWWTETDNDERETTEAGQLLAELYGVSCDTLAADLRAESAK